MDKNKGVVSCDKLWIEKPKWLAEVINENTLLKTDYVDEDWVNKNLPAYVITALLRACGIEYEVDWTSYMGSKNGK